MSIDNHSDNRRVVDDINRRNAEAIERQAEALRREIVDSVYEATLALAIEQEDEIDAIGARGQLGLVPIRRKVLQTFTGLPFEGDEPQNALRLLLEPDEERGQQRTGQEKMYTFLPIPDDIVLDETFDPSAIERPKYVGVELCDSEGSPTIYLVYESEDNKKIEAYRPAIREGDDKRGFEALGEKAIWLALSHRVNPNDVVISEILTKMTDWTAQVQDEVLPEDYQ